MRYLVAALCFISAFTVTTAAHAVDPTPTPTRTPSPTPVPYPTPYNPLYENWSLVTKMAPKPVNIEPPPPSWVFNNQVVDITAEGIGWFRTLVNVSIEMGIWGLIQGGFLFIATVLVLIKVMPTLMDKVREFRTRRAVTTQRKTYNKYLR